MIPLYTQDEFDSARSRDKLPLRCKSCQKTFEVSKHILQAVITGSDHHTGDYCSLKCIQKDVNPPTVVVCEQCGKSFTKMPKEIKKSKHNFCCQSHAAKYNNAHKKTGTRISKLELWLQEQLTALYPDLEFHFNRTDAINAELDIYVPELRVAFEINGIFHYEPIFGPEKLASTQTNDERKMQACAEHGISFCIIDTSRETYFKVGKSRKYLDIIVKVLADAGAPPSQNRVEVT